MINYRDVSKMSRLLRKLVYFEATYDELLDLGLIKIHRISVASAVEASLVPADFTTRSHLNVMEIGEKGDRIIKLFEDFKKEINLDSVTFGKRTSSHVPTAKAKS